jgi:hypothetical protein
MTSPTSAYPPTTTPSAYPAAPVYTHAAQGAHAAPHPPTPTPAPSKLPEAAFRERAAAAVASRLTEKLALLESGAMERHEAERGQLEARHGALRSHHDALGAERDALGQVSFAG